MCVCVIVLGEWGATIPRRVKWAGGAVLQYSGRCWNPMWAFPQTGVTSSLHAGKFPNRSPFCPLQCVTGHLDRFRQAPTSGSPWPEVRAGLVKMKECVQETGMSAQEKDSPREKGWNEAVATGLKCKSTWIRKCVCIYVASVVSNSLRPYGL